MSLVFRVYQQWLSPFFHFLCKTIGGSPLAGCRFVPSCSEFAKQAIQSQGVFKGGIRAALRLCSCHPLSGRGGYDPV